MSRPTEQQIAAAAEILAKYWDADATKAGGFADAYTEWGAGIADMIIHEPPEGTVTEYLGVLEEQLGVPESPLADRERWARQLTAAVRQAEV